VQLNTLYNEDCLVGMNRIEPGSVDFILCDLPYGTTRNKWDSIIPLEPLWTCYRRILKPSGVVALFAQLPFSITLGASNLDWLRYEWIWNKVQGTGHLNAKTRPLKAHENILIFSPSGTHTYNPQFTPGKPYRAIRGRPSTNYGRQTEHITESDGNRYPTTVLTYKKDRPRVHPTQKPVALCQYLIETFTSPGELVLDNCIGSGTTALAAINAGRTWLGFESDQQHYQNALERIERHLPARATDRLAALFAEV
jgi:site-specific DNA-methyltransferase (adenine-specific)